MLWESKSNIINFKLYLTILADFSRAYLPGASRRVMLGQFRVLVLYMLTQPSH